MNNKIKVLRNEHALSLNDLTKVLKDKNITVSSNILAKYEDNKIEPSFKIWNTLANYFDVTIVYLQGISLIKSSKYLEYIENNFDDISSKKQQLKKDNIPENEIFSIMQEYTYNNYKYLDNIIFNFNKEEFSKKQLNNYKNIFTKIGNNLIKDSHLDRTPNETNNFDELLFILSSVFFTYLNAHSGNIKSQELLSIYMDDVLEFYNKN